MCKSGIQRKEHAGDTQFRGCWHLCGIQSHKTRSSTRESEGGIQKRSRPSLRWLMGSECEETRGPAKETGKEQPVGQEETQAQWGPVGWEENSQGKGRMGSCVHTAEGSSHMTTEKQPWTYHMEATGDLFF